MRERAAFDPASAPGIPTGADGPVFAEPWEAQAFAMTLALHEQGLFTWSEWTATLIGEIGRAQAAGDRDAGETYYRDWLAALERLLVQKGVIDRADVVRHREAWSRAAQATPHGSPILLCPNDVK